MKKLKSSLYWECRIKYEKLRYLFLALACADILLLVMPESWCRYIDTAFMPAVIFLSTFYAVSALIMIFYPSLSMVNLYESLQRDMERFTGVSALQRYAVRLAVNLAATCILYVLVKGGEILLKKFADVSHSYFSLQVDLSAPGLILLVSILFPILYSWAFLILYRRNRNRHGVLALIIAALLFNMLHFAGITEIWVIVIRTALCIPFFIAAIRMEERLDL